MRSVIALEMGAAWIGVASISVAQSMTPDKEHAKFVDRAKAVSPMTEFGDQINQSLTHIKLGQLSRGRKT